MSQQSRKHRGYATERLVASYLQQWWPSASVGRGQGKDCLNVPFDIEVKARNCMLTLGDLVELLRKAGYHRIPGEVDWDKTLVRCGDCGNWKIKWWECKACGKEADNADV